MDYTNNGEYHKGYYDGLRDVVLGQPVRNLYYYPPSYLLGYFRGREAAHTYFDPTKCGE